MRKEPSCVHSSPQIRLQGAGNSCGKALLTVTYTGLSLAETDTHLKSAFHLVRTGSVPGALKVIKVTQSKATARRYQVQWTLEQFEHMYVRNFLHTAVLPGLNEALSEPISGFEETQPN